MLRHFWFYRNNCLEDTYKVNCLVRISSPKRLGRKALRGGTSLHYNPTHSGLKRKKGGGMNIISHISSSSPHLSRWTSCSYQERRRQWDHKGEKGGKSFPPACPLRPQRPPFPNSRHPCPPPTLARATQKQCSESPSHRFLLCVSLSNSCFSLTSAVLVHHLDKNKNKPEASRYYK